MRRDLGRGEEMVKDPGPHFLPYLDWGSPSAVTN